ncbi:LysE family translocator [uncultured Sphingomonas sp.]|uniref:LysE family translocator n=1 Tax=uncultured Sphingomonas sp. TaxID=158754 RepID=UPI002600A030|nr:LysE family translocator [uncultured Sphingomonas sp.]
MTWATWWLFTCTTALIAATPGPNMLHIMSRSVQLGFGRSTIAMAGCLSAVVICVTLSSLGLGALLTASRPVFEMVRYVGVAYLLWLAWKSWTAAEPGDAAGLHSDFMPDVPSISGIYRTALFTGLSNPKLIVFAAAFFPQFIRADHAWGPQFGILVATFGVIEMGCYLAYATGGRTLAGFLSNAKRRRAFNRATGVMFAAFGCGLLAYRA